MQRTRCHLQVSFKKWRVEMVWGQIGHPVRRQPSSPFSLLKKAVKTFPRMLLCQVPCGLVPEVRVWRMDISEQFPHSNLNGTQSLSLFLSEYFAVGFRHSVETRPQGYSYPGFWSGAICTQSYSGGTRSSILNARSQHGWRQVVSAHVLLPASASPRGILVPSGRLPTAHLKASSEIQPQ